jgi:hypothetical protein
MYQKLPHAPIPCIRNSLRCPSSSPYPSWPHARSPGNTTSASQPGRGAPAYMYVPIHDGLSDEVVDPTGQPARSSSLYLSRVFGWQSRWGQISSIGFDLTHKDEAGWLGLLPSYTGVRKKVGRQHSWIRSGYMQNRLSQVRKGRAT